MSTAPSISVPSTFFDKLVGERQVFVAFAKKRAPECDAEDLVQQAFARAQEKIDTLREPRRAKAWFYRILRRLIADHLMRRSMQFGKVEQLAAELAQVPDDDLAVCACGLGLLNSLPDSYRDIIERVDLKDQALSGVASDLGITRGNATTRLHRARSALRKALLQHCGSAIESRCSSCNC